MKIKSLQISVLTLLFGVSAMFFTQKSGANNVIKSPEAGLIDAQNLNDFFGKSTKKSKKMAPTKNMLSDSWVFNGADNASGKIMGIVYDSESETIYTGTAHGSVWKSTNGGNNWTKMAVENNKNLFVTCMYFDVSTKTIFVGTGGDFKGQGVYKSENGAPFTLIPGSEAFNNVNKIASYGNMIYAATNSGLMCYKNGQWVVCTGTKESTPITLDGDVRDLSINAAGLVIIAIKNECYISTTGASDGFVYNSALYPFTVVAANISVVTSPVNDNVLYVVGAKMLNGRLDNVLLSEDQGETWELIYTFFPATDLLEGNGGKINRVFADPQNPYIIYVASRNVWKGQRYASGYFDFGLSALCQSSSFYDDDRYMHSSIHDMCFYETPGESTRYAYIATDGGVYNSIIKTDPANNLLSPTRLLRNMEIMSCDFLAPSSVPGESGMGQFLLGTPTLGANSIGITSNYNIGARPIWALEVGTDFYSSEGKGGACAVSLVNPSCFIYSLEQEVVTVKVSGNDYKNIFTVRRSEDKGYSYQPLPGEVPVQWMSDTVLKPELAFASPFLMWETFDAKYTPDTVWFKADVTRNFFAGDTVIFAKSKNFGYPVPFITEKPLNNGDSIPVPDRVQNRVYFSNLNKLYMTREALDFTKTPATWYQIANLGTNDTASFFSITNDGNDLFVGSRLGNVYHISGLVYAYNYTTAAVASPDTKVTTTLIHKFTDKKVLSLAVNPSDANHVVVVLDGGGDNVFETHNATDATATFTSIKGNLPNIVYSVIISQRNDSKGAIIVGTEKGIWTKAPSATEWSFESEGIGEMPVKVLNHVTTYRPAVNGVPYFNTSANQVQRENYPSNDFNYLAIYAGTYGAGVFSYGENKIVGIDEQNITKLSGGLTVIPNPVIDMATIKLNVEKESAFLQIFDVTGRCVKEQTVTDNDVQISFKDYEAGVYIIRVRQGDVVKSAKVVKQ